MSEVDRTKVGRLQEEVYTLTHALRAQTAFICDASHDLRAPLAAILSCTSVMSASPVREPTQIRRVERHAQELLAMLDQMIEYARAAAALNPSQVEQALVQWQSGANSGKVSRSHDDQIAVDFDGTSRDVWVVEDCDIVSDALCMYLHEAQINVERFADGESLLAYMNTPGLSKPGAVITDLRLGKVDGFGVLQAVHARWPQAPVILMTSLPTHRKSPVPIGFSGVLDKPVHRAVLKCMLASVFEIDLPAAAAVTACASLARPAAGIVAELLTLARMGAISDLVEFAEAHALQQPTCRPYLMQLKRWAERGDLKTCSKILAT